MSQASKFTRRGFVRGAAAVTGAGLLATGGVAEAHFRRRRALCFEDPIFSLGVASGDPRPDGFVLWTRLAPDPLNGGGMPRMPVLVQYEVATDEHMRRVVRRGLAIARPGLGHSVHVQIRGLRSDRFYYYRFYALGQASRIGRSRTFPSRRDHVRAMRFGLVSCQDYQNGYYSAYANMAEEDLDFVVHAGDYIYEYGPREGAVRPHIGEEIITVEDYRNRYAQYRLDPALQDAHANFPFIVTWDDHEVDNNYAADIPEDDQSPEAFLARRAAAYQVYYESMPLPRFTRPEGPDMRLYRDLSFGNLANLFVLDTRQFRSDQPCGDGFTFCPEVFDQNATVLGQAQMDWLQGGLLDSGAVWNVLAQQVMVTKWDATVLANFQFPLFNVDAWDGYQPARDKLVSLLADPEVANPVVLTGDIHSSWAADLKTDFADPSAPAVGTEFVCTSISSDFPAQFVPPVAASLAQNPHIKFFDGTYRGYAVHEVTDDLWTCRFKAVESILTPESPGFTLASYVVEAGNPGAQEA